MSAAVTRTMSAQSKAGSQTIFLILPLAGGEELDLLAVGERQPQISHLSVDAHEDGLLGELRPDCRGRVEARRTVGEFEFRVVG